MKTSLPLAILAVATALAAAPSPAAPVVSLVDWNDARSLTVEHKDLNLATPSGIGMLHRRIDAAVAQV
ncbi:MAG: UrcA family protein, partial [Steroidobacteraceae bacterium]